MRQYSMEFDSVVTELTFRCNAACPACGRHSFANNLNDDKYHFKFDKFKIVFTEKFLSKLKILTICGNYGDFILCEDALEIIKYIRTFLPKESIIVIITNGSARNKIFWNTLGNILFNQDKVIFSIDGLEDTHSIYRINTRFDRVIENAQEVIKTNSPLVIWKMILFSHNQHQLNDCISLATKLNFDFFYKVFTTRNYNVPVEKHPFNNPEADLDLECKAAAVKDCYISPEGLVFRCCWTAHCYYKFNKKQDFKFPKNFDEDYNAFKVPIETILNYSYWDKLDNFLVKCPTKAFKVCKDSCNKKMITSLSDRINLKTLKSEKYAYKNVKLSNF